MIHTAKYFKFMGDSEKEWHWEYIMDIDAAAGLNEIECTVETVPTNVYFHLVDWSGQEDRSEKYLEIIKQDIYFGKSRQGSWTKYNIELNLDATGSAFVYDIDGDSNPDVVATGEIADDVVWYEAPDDPTGTWTKHNIDTDFDGARGVFVYDIDDDNYPDVVATGFVADDVVWYVNPIPEFSDIIFPIFGVVALFVFFRKKRR